MIYKNFKFSSSEINRLKNSDENMCRLIEVVGEIKRQYIPEPFIALVNSIVYQQLAYKAANSIWNKFENTVGDITPETIFNADYEILRSVGLSGSKINYIKNIAEAVLGGRLDLANLENMSDKEITDTLVLIKGVGLWTAQMFLIFSLNRRDILSFYDLGIRRGLQWLYNMPNEPSKIEFEAFRQRFSPDNTLASMYLWEITIRNLFCFKDVFEVK